MGGFGIGTNTQTPDCGSLKKRFMEIACDCYFTASGRPIIRYFKYRDEEGVIQTVHDIRTVFQEEKNYAGCPSRECSCQAVIDGIQEEFKLIFFKDQCRWVLVVG